MAGAVSPSPSSEMALGVDNLLVSEGRGLPPSESGLRGIDIVRFTSLRLELGDASSAAVRAMARILTLIARGGGAPFDASVSLGASAVALLPAERLAERRDEEMRLGVPGLRRLGVPGVRRLGVPGVRAGRGMEPLLPPCPAVGAKESVRLTIAAERGEREGGGVGPLLAPEAGGGVGITKGGAGTRGAMTDGGVGVGADGGTGN